MRRSTSIVSMALAAIAMLAPPVFAHHSFAAEYDANAAVAVKGEQKP